MTNTFGNLFLDSLSTADQSALRPHLREVRPAVGDVLIEQGAVVQRAVFPVRAQLCNVIHLDDGGRVEVSFVGHEGLGGLAPIMTNRPCGWEVVVRAPGVALVCPASLIRELQAARPTFMARLLDLTQFYQDQAAQIAVCNASHRILPRVSRWLLMAHDLAPGDSVHMTQQELSELLASDRTTVNEAAQQLKTLRAIRYGRGAIQVLDREVLKGAACGCYDALKSRAAELHIALQAGVPADA